MATPRGDGARDLGLGASVGLASWLICAASARFSLARLGDLSRAARAALHAVAVGELLFAFLFLPVAIASLVAVRRSAGEPPRGVHAFLATALAASLLARVVIALRMPVLWPPAAASLAFTTTLVVATVAAVRVVARRGDDPATAAGGASWIWVVLSLLPWIVAPLRSLPGGEVTLRAAGFASPALGMAGALGLDLFHLESLYRLLGLGASPPWAPRWWVPSLAYLTVAGLAIVTEAAIRSSRRAPEGEIRW